MKFMERGDALLFAETNLPKLTGFAQVPPVFTGLGFSTKGSNISSDDIGTSVCTMIDNTRLDAKVEFENFYNIRNASAHDSNTNVPTGDLNSYIDLALLVGLAIDIIITHAVDCYVSARTTRMAEDAVNKLAPRLRFLDQLPDGKWKDVAIAKKRARKIYADFEQAKLAVIPNTQYIVRDTRLFPTMVF